MYSGILFSEIAIERIGLWNGYNSENPITYSFSHTPSEGQEHGGPQHSLFLSCTEFLFVFTCPQDSL